ncbi:MAG: aromatic-ring-hydroxylating dioxygenase subunit beta [Kiloniellales bacterium]
MDQRLLLRLELDALYADYAAALDQRDYAAWPRFFTEDCLYQVIPRENHEQGLPLATILCESRGMLEDRVYAVRETSMYGPRALRHLVSGLRIVGVEEEEIAAEANFCVLQTLNDRTTEVFLAGRYLDRLVWEEGTLRFKQRICVFDTNLVPNTLVVPV